MNLQGMNRKLNLIIILDFLSTNKVYGRLTSPLHPHHGHHKHIKGYFEYSAITCRAYTASITDFGGVGDGVTSNTKAFQTAIDHFGQLESVGGGSLLYVPPGRWLTGSFNLTSHFTMFLHQDIVLLATQVLIFEPPGRWLTGNIFLNVDDGVCMCMIRGWGVEMTAVIVENEGEWWVF
ncbi:putative pectate lyase superfamily protein [Helianthus debilis subsp. tardiflorus]